MQSKIQSFHLSFSHYGMSSLLSTIAFISLKTARIYNLIISEEAVMGSSPYQRKILNTVLPVFDRLKICSIHRKGKRHLHPHTTPFHQWISVKNVFQCTDRHSNSMVLIQIILTSLDSSFQLLLLIQYMPLLHLCFPSPVRQREFRSQKLVD